MIGKTLGTYFAVRFGKTMFGMLAALLFLIVTVDFVGQLGKVPDGANIAIGQLYLVSVLRTPIFLEKAFPFACLFAAMITLTQLNNKLELVVARAAGVSVWQILLPISIAAALIGMIESTAFNPLAIAANEQSKELASKIFTGKTIRKNTNRKDVWLRQETGDTSAVIHASNSLHNGTILEDVQILEFKNDDSVAARIDAARATYKGSYWQLDDVSFYTKLGTIEKADSYQYATNLSENFILGAVGDPESISFWKLQETAVNVAKSGVNSNPYLVQFHSLTALPLLLVSMVLIAATVSLRFVRFGQSGRMILGGILSGFVLYIVTKLVGSLGGNGIVSPSMAAWSPSVVANLVGMSILLHQEDG